MSPSVSVVVPLSGDPDGALRCLLALAEVPDVPAHEVVVVDDAAEGLDALLARLDGDAIVVSRTDRGGVLRAWSSGVGRAAGDVVVLLAGPATVAPGFLAPLVAALHDPQVVAASAGEGEPVAAAALAVRRADWVAVVSGADDRPAGPRSADPGVVPDGLAVASVLTRLAAHGTVARVPAAAVASTSSAPDATTMPTARRDAVARGLDRHPPGTAPELTIVIPTLDAAGDRLRACVRAIQDRTDVPHEIVVVDNGAPPQGFTAPVNAGLRAARGRYAVVCNDDVEVLPGWWAPLRRALDAGHPVAFPWTVDGAMREDFAAWCFAVSRDALDRFAVLPGEFLDPGLIVWYQDTDLLARLRAAGTPPMLVRDAHVRHGLSETVATDDPLLRAWIDGQVEEDRRAFHARHGVGVPGAFAVGAD